MYLNAPLTMLVRACTCPTAWPYRVMREQVSSYLGLQCQRPVEFLSIRGADVGCCMTLTSSYGETPRKRRQLFEVPASELYIPRLALLSSARLVTDGAFRGSLCAQQQLQLRLFGSRQVLVLWTEPGATSDAIRDCGSCAGHNFSIVDHAGINQRTDGDVDRPDDGDPARRVRVRNNRDLEQHN